MGRLVFRRKKSGKGHRIVFFGNERLATGVSTSAPTLQALIAGGYEVKAVVSNYERGTSRNARELEIKEVAQAHKIPVLLPEKPADILDQLKAFDAEVAILVAYGRIVPQSVIDIFPKGIINIHPSLLPLHRGSTPLESVMLDGSKETGVSLMKLVKAMDAGPVFSQTNVILTGQETKQDLYDNIITVGSNMIIKSLPGILNGSITAKPQNDSAATYDKMIKKEDGKIDWIKPAEQIEREIRAYAEWPKSSAVIAGKEVTITKAHAVPGRTFGSKPGATHVFDGKNSVTWIEVSTSKGSLQIERLKPAGKKEMSAKEFLAGYGKNI